MPFFHRPPPVRYPVALAIGAAVLLGRWLLDPLLGLRQPYMGCLVATFIATRRCGLGPGLLTLVLTFVISDRFFVLPESSVWSGDPSRVAASLITLGFAVVMCWIVAGERTARDSAEAEANAAHERQQRLEQEISRSRSLEADLRVSREEFRTLATRAPVGIMAADPRGLCTFANEKWQELTGLSSAETLGHSWSRAIHPDDLATTMAKWNASVTAREPYVNELRILHTDGSVHPVLAAALPIHDASGSVAGFIGTVMDLTDRHLREEMLRRLIDTQEREKQSLCHEFHDGLIQYAVGSRMLLEAYLRDHPDVPQRDVLETVIGHLARGIDDGRLLIRGIRTAVLDDLGLEAALDDLVDQSAAAGVAVAMALPTAIGPLPPTLETTIYRVVQESLANVRRHSGAAAARVTLARDGDRLSVEIADEGCGFDPAAARHRGFGLTGMVERVRLAGGECRIDSAPGRGARIGVTLPVPVPASPAPARL